MSEAALCYSLIEQLTRAGYVFRIAHDKRKGGLWYLLSIPDMDGHDEALSAGITLSEALSSYAKKVL